MRVNRSGRAGSLLPFVALGVLLSGPSWGVPLAGHVPHAALASSHSMGHMNAAEKLSLALTLPLRNQAELDTLLRRVYDPHDSLYHHYLTTQQFVDEFGPAQADYNTVKAFAISHGLSIVGTHPNRTILDVTGSVNAIENTFKIRLNQYQNNTSGRVFHASETNPDVPPDVASHLAGVVGLSNVDVRHSQARLLSDRAAALHPNQIGTGQNGGLTPSDIATAYNLNNLSVNGSGQTLGLYELDGYTASDVTAYENSFGLPAVPLRNILIDGYDGSANSNAGEVTLDIELQIAVAPRASQVIVYEAPNSSTGSLDAFNRIATDNLAKQISVSWAEPEIYVDPNQLNAENAIFKQMSLQGQSIYAASGDSGAFADNFTICVNDTASQPYMVAVGGTRLNLNQNGTFNFETSWNTDGFASDGGGGGGISTVWTIPTWQNNVVSPGTLGSTTMRNVPDVALDSDPDTGYAIYFQGGWTVYGGTSCAAPLWAGFTALVNQLRLNNNQGYLGFANPAIYKLATSAAYANDFHDVTGGSTNLFYPTVTGYDDATGWGSFNGANLLAALANVAQAPSPPTGLIATAGNAAVTLNWTASSGATSYNVKRALSSGGPFVTVGSPGVTSYVDNGLTNGTTYYYVVTAVSAGGESGNSTVANATPVAPLPAVPAGLTANASSGQVSLSWTAAAGATTYNLKRSNSATGPFVTLTNTSLTTYIDTTTTDGVTYYYVVSAVNTTGESANSSPSVSAIYRPPLPTVPTGLSATAGSSQVTLSWTAVASATSYTVKRGGSASGPFTILGGTATTGFSDNTVTNGTTYWYVVSASNSTGTSAYSPGISATPKASALAAPSGLTAIAGSGQVSLTWTPVSGATSYYVKRSNSASGPFVTVGTPTTPSYVSSGLTNGLTYFFVIVAVNAQAQSPSSPSISATPFSIAGGVLLDTFTDSSGVRLTSHRMDIGPGWVGASNFVISNNTAVCNMTAAGSYVFTTSDARMSDGTLTCNITDFSGAISYSRADIVLRYADINDNYLLQVYNGRLSLYQRTNGAAYASVSGASGPISVPNGTSWALRVVLKGPKITAYCNGIQVFSTSAATYKITGTRFGLAGISTPGAQGLASWDNFEVTP